MLSTCDYCGGSIGEAEKKCGNCGAPVVRDQSPLPDFRSCPFCHRRLVALASPACNYCGRRLPDDYIKAREADLKRVTEVSEGSETNEIRRKVDELIRHTAQGHSSASLGVFDISSLTDLFS